MNAIMNTKSFSGRLGLMSLLLMSCLSLYGCSRPNAEAGVAIQTASSSTSTHTPIATIATPTLSGPEFDATKIAGIATVEAPFNERATSIAEGTPQPTPRYIPLPTITLVNFWTPTLGISWECAQGNHQFNYGGCWAGIINDHYVFVDTGALMADPPQGVVRVYTETMDLIRSTPLQDYPTPLRAGRVHPTQVVWPIMTLVTMDSNPPVYFAFDLTTHQWVSPTPGPSPSALVSPAPSVSPLPTQQP